MNDIMEEKQTGKIKSKDVMIAMRGTQELKDTLDKLAKEHGVTVSRIIEYSLANTFKEVKDLLSRL